MALVPTPLKMRLPAVEPQPLLEGDLLQLRASSGTPQVILLMPAEVKFQVLRVKPLMAGDTGVLGQV